MPRFESDPTSQPELEFHRLLAAASVAWVFVLLLVPSLAGNTLCLLLTVTLIACNFLVSLAQLIGKGKVLILLNVAQLPLFCVLNYQLFCALGADHYRFDTSPGFWSWIQLTAVHFLRAIDVIDGLDAYGIDLQNIEHDSLLAGVVLLWMHLSVDIFLISLILRYLSLARHGIGHRLRETCDQIREETEDLETDDLFFADLGSQLGELLCRNVVMSAEERKGAILAILAYCGLLAVICAVVQQWQPWDWLLWPLDNVLRTVDIGDMFQIFDWRLHGVEMGLFTITLAVSIRICAGVATALLLGRVCITTANEDLIYRVLDETAGIQLRMAAIKTLGNRRAKEAIGPLDAVLSGTHSEEELRRGAASALGLIGPPARPALKKGLRDPSEQVRCAVVEALGDVGGLEVLKLALRDGSEEVLCRTVETLGRMGPVAVSTLDDVIRKTPRNVTDTVRRKAAEALGQIGPEALRALIGALSHDSQSVRHAAAEALGHLGVAATPAVPKLRDMVDKETSWEIIDAAGRALARIEGR